MVLIIQTIIILIVLIGILVFVHELGHFIAAKLVGVKVEEFALGFKKKIFSKKIGETEYIIKLLPLGGYVKLLGDEERSNDPRSFSSKTIPQRALILFAGVTMNFILGICIFYLFLSMSSFNVAIPRLVNYHFIGVNPQTNTNGAYIVIDEVAKDSPAEKAGITKETLLYSMDGEEIKSIDKFISLLDKKAGQIVKFTLIDINNNKIDKEVHLNNKNGNNPILGIEYYPFEFYNLDYSGNRVYLSGVNHSINMLGYQLVAFGGLIKQSFKEKDVAPVANNVSGVVGLAQQTYEISKIGEFKDILNLAAVVSIMLAFMNMLPIPVLDGGHVAFLILEKVRGRKLAEKYEEWAYRIGFFFLVGLTVLITIKDFIQFDIFQRIFNKIISIF